MLFSSFVLFYFIFFYSLSLIIALLKSMLTINIFSLQIIHFLTILLSIVTSILTTIILFKKT
jgi:hypothetical protein